MSRIYSDRPASEGFGPIVPLVPRDPEQAAFGVCCPAIIQSIKRLKQDILQRRTVSLDLEETLIALSIASTTNPTAELAMEQLTFLAECDMHMSHMPTPGDESGLRRLGINTRASRPAICPRVEPPAALTCPVHPHTLSAL